MLTFAYTRTLGWAHQGDKAVLCHLVTFRDSDMLIPGGSLIAGQVDHENEGIEWFPQLPRHVKREARKALVANDVEEDRIRREEDWSPSRLSYMPTSIYAEGDDLYIVAFTEDDAKEAAYKAGLRVNKGWSWR